MANTPRTEAFKIGDMVRTTLPYLGYGKRRRGRVARIGRTYIIVRLNGVAGETEWLPEQIERYR